ncbi:hypothetical protein KBI31_00195 [Patescibacteria group bacterium]|jgi:glutaredoxin|nr:hypothetical protein [Patescibacteria group bacterium]HPD07899.1 hypothetical protein [bacterium]HRU89917.1 hypothetical protein [Patescibacteria group bacterium]
MNYRVIIASGLFLAVTIFSCYALTKHQTSNNHPDSQPATASQRQPAADFILYYGETCPHCHIVTNYIATSKIREKFQLLEKEVYNNETNARELTTVAHDCGLSQNNIGVPLLWDGHQCIIGDQPIIDFLNNKLNQVP